MNLSSAQQDQATSLFMRRSRNVDSSLEYDLPGKCCPRLSLLSRPCGSVWTLLCYDRPADWSRVSRELLSSERYVPGMGCLTSIDGPSNCSNLFSSRCIHPLNLFADCMYSHNTQHEKMSSAIVWNILLRSCRPPQVSNALSQPD